VREDGLGRGGKEKKGTGERKGKAGGKGEPGGKEGRERIEGINLPHGRLKTLAALV